MSKQKYNEEESVGVDKQWKYLAEWDAWCLENLVYCEKPSDSEKQSLHIYVPECYLNEDGSICESNVYESQNGICYTARTAPVVYYNGIGGYAECVPEKLGRKNVHFLKAGYVLVSVGARGRQTKSKAGAFIGKAPAGIVDLKAGIRFLRRYKDELPGDYSKIISVGTSAGGAMSALLGTTGDNVHYFSWLEEIGAAMEESDAVFASQCYCPITNLEHADMAYEWMFRAKKIWNMHAIPQVMDTVTQFLSKEFSEKFVEYVNSLGLGFTLDMDGRGGSFYHGMMNVISRSCNKFLNLHCTNIEEKMKLIEEMNVDSKMIRLENGNAVIDNLDLFVKQYIGRMKPCPAFDYLDCRSRENEEFGCTNEEYRHFAETTCPELSNEIKKVRFLMNPMNFINSDEITKKAKHFRIRLGSMDADTSFAISYLMSLAMGNDPDIQTVDYELVWGMGHGDADYPGEVVSWINEIVS